MLYKDDTIFDHMAFFQDVDLNAKVFKKKDVFQARSLLGQPVEVSSEESRHSEHSFSVEFPQDISGIQAVDVSGIMKTNDPDRSSL